MEREIPGFPYRDAMGCYPLFVCEDWTRLDADLQDIGSEIVSLSLVTDPFGDYDTNYLQQCFRDVVFPFKEHFVVDLQRPVIEIVCRHHRYYARKALENVHVEKVHDPSLFLSEWTDLYATLIARHNLTGISAFSRAAFARQLAVPGVVVLKAVSEDSVVAAQLWYVQDDIAYSHLTAVSSVGYDVRASYALYYCAIEFFSASSVKWLDFGGGAGTNSDGTDGLSVFKRGWSTATRTAYFCGRIFDRRRYSQIVKQKGVSATDYFPAYRKGEFE